MVYLKKNITNLITALLICFNAYGIKPQSIHVLNNIAYKGLPLAHTELIHLEKQVVQGLEQLNITNSIEQKEYLIQEFSSDVRKEAHTAYKGRQDHEDMVDAFNAIKVEDTLITILKDTSII